ncbi:MAG: ABC transporter permease [Trueperaceae bacterium]|nr:MAG: ABC transporter permease [Trueperaceae bacterium]
MLQYFIKRIAQLVPTVLGVIFITFSLGYFGPGDPLKHQLGERLPSDPAQLERLRKHYGLDRPFHVQFSSYIGKLARGDMGISIVVQSKRPIRDMLGKALRTSVQLGGAAALIIFVLGIPLGILAAYRKNTWLDYVIVSLAALLPTVPPFVLAPLLLILFVLQLKLLPASFGWAGLFDSRAILPLIILVIGPMLIVVRQTRNSIIEALTQDYVRTARSKGVLEHKVLSRHVLKNAMIPVLTSMGFIISGLLTGSLFVESIFGIPGFGKLIYDGLRAYDYPLILGTTLVGTLIILASNLLVDLLYPFFDPRVQFG